MPFLVEDALAVQRVTGWEDPGLPGSVGLTVGEAVIGMLSKLVPINASSVYLKIEVLLRIPARVAV